MTDRHSSNKSELSDFHKWDSDRLGLFFRQKGLGAYCKTLQQHKITGGLAPLLKDDDLKEMGISAYLDASSPMLHGEHRARAAKDAILHCSAFIVILSGISSSTAMLTDQLSFAEDRGRPIVPILLSSPALSLGKRYTLSINRVFHFAEGIGYDASLQSLYHELCSLTSSTTDTTTPSPAGVHHHGVEPE